MKAIVEGPHRGHMVGRGYGCRAGGRYGHHTTARHARARAARQGRHVARAPTQRRGPRAQEGRHQGLHDLSDRGRRSGGVRDRAAVCVRGDGQSRSSRSSARRRGGRGATREARRVHGIDASLDREPPRRRLPEPRRCRGAVREPLSRDAGPRARLHGLRARRNVPGHEASAGGWHVRRLVGDDVRAGRRARHHHAQHALRELRAARWAAAGGKDAGTRRAPRRFSPKEPGSSRSSTKAFCGAWPISASEPRSR